MMCAILCDVHAGASNETIQYVTIVEVRTDYKINKQTI